MELFLNLCWLALLLPAYFLWRRRVSSEPWTRASFVIICTLGCALVLLFPVISASDDLHTVGQAIEESERSFRHAGHCPCDLHAVNQVSQFFVTAPAASEVVLEQVGTVFSFPPHSSGTPVSVVASGRAPPCRRAVSL
jgi:hypothetical protein